MANTMPSSNVTPTIMLPQLGEVMLVKRNENSLYSESCHISRDITNSPLTSLGSFREKHFEYSQNILTNLQWLIAVLPLFMLRLRLGTGHLGGVRNSKGAVNKYICMPLRSKLLLNLSLECTACKRYLWVLGLTQLLKLRFECATNWVSATSWVVTVIVCVSVSVSACAQSAKSSRWLGHSTPPNAMHERFSGRVGAKSVNRRRRWLTAKWPVTRGQLCLDFG